MTAFPSDARLPSSGPRSNFRGEILQRGGEELLLEKVPARFTTRLTTPTALEPLQQRLNPLAVRPVAGGQLVEWQMAENGLEAALTAARQDPTVRFASHVYRLVDSPQTWVYLTDQLTVQFAPETTAATIDALLGSLGIAIENPLEGMPNTFVVRVTSAAIENPIKIANRLMALETVLAAEPNLSIETGSLYRPTDDRYPQQWHLFHNGGASLTPGSHISAEAAWDITRGSRSVVIAVSDDGFDLNHPDLQGVGKLVAPLDLRDKDALPLPAKQDENHGTAVAGLAIGEENTTGIVGVAPGCAFLPIRTTGFIDDGAIEQLFDEAVRRGTAVIVCSWSPAANYFPLTLRQTNALTRAATTGRNGKGCVIVFSAGNANRPVSGTVNETQWPKNALNGPTRWLSGFAIHPDVIAVSASTSLGTKAAYSNWGEHIAVAAPSNNAPPNMALPQVGNVPTGPPLTQYQPGRGMVTSDRTQGAGYSSDDYTNTFGGTSSSCPVVAGVAGLMLSVNPSLTARQVREILQTTADKIVDRTPDPQLGLQYGTYNANGHSQWFGYGKVNAAAAVREAQRRAFAGRQLGRVVQQQNQTEQAIPDNQPGGVESSVAIAAAGTVADIQVEVVLEHEFLGDISLHLVAPNGITAIIQSRTLGRQSELHQTYSLETTPVLVRLLGQPAQGTWRLRAVDSVAGATGTLRRWGLTLGVS
ncbi:S8 family serine peptidase [Leptolyngbya sp. CCNP1308]|uniref:S8 family serine peptidase n=1 Tax=Leptolyngbya sp. CCNP1308 TaxID=3110255 RepID=UPI002B21EAEA|nr:S8 family serine peptidase [Leptolyngbya sp. CCNP1308]MEA5447261.1 S8 family serine peptidase [Leptolyngbya sp. CCNP1308]